MENDKKDERCPCVQRMTNTEIAKIQMENESDAIRRLENYANKTSDDFIASKVQISGILLGLLSIGLFNASMEDGMDYSEKVFFLVTIVGLLGSLISELLAIAKKSPFWISKAEMYQKNVNLWAAYLRGETSYEYARNERKKGTGEQSRWMSDPIWSDIQTWLLIVSFISLGTMIFLFTL